MEGDAIIGVMGQYVVSCPCGAEHIHEMEACEDFRDAFSHGLAHDAQRFTCWCGRAYALTVEFGWIVTDMETN